MAVAVLWGCWRSRGDCANRPFPVAFSIVWFAFMLLLPMTFGGTSAYQNYINNAFLWLLVGILFRLPEIAATPDVAVVKSSADEAKRLQIWKPSFGAARRFADSTSSLVRLNTPRLTAFLLEFLFPANGGLQLAFARPHRNIGPNSIWSGERKTRPEAS